MKSEDMSVSITEHAYSDTVAWEFCLINTSVHRCTVCMFKQIYLEVPVPTSALNAQIDIRRLLKVGLYMCTPNPTTVTAPLTSWRNAPILFACNLGFSNAFHLT